MFFCWFFVGGKRGLFFCSVFVFFGAKNPSYWFIKETQNQTLCLVSDRDLVKSSLMQSVVGADWWSQGSKGPVPVPPVECLFQIPPSLSWPVSVFSHRLCFPSFCDLAICTQKFWLAQHPARVVPYFLTVVWLFLLRQKYLFSSFYCSSQQ